MSEFNCNKCGFCCSELPAHVLTLLDFPVHPRGKGCGFQNEDKSCSIYATRPEICRVRPDSGGGFAASESACVDLQNKFGEDD